MWVFKEKIFLFTLLGVLLGANLTAQSEAKVDTSKVKELIQFSQETYTDEILIIHNNEVISHWKNPDCDSVYFNTASMVKSWTGLVIGILIDQELISSEEDLVCTYLPEWKDGCDYKVTIKNLLTMSSGLNRKPGALGILAQEDMNEYVRNVTLDTLPDIRFNYSNESVQLLGLIIEKVSGRSANDYFREVLFQPLGMDSTKLGKDPTGNDVVFGGAITTIEDASKVGMLMANGGTYENRRIVSEYWVNKSTTPSDKAPYYGFLWWLDNNSENKNYAATGDFGQMTIVFRDLNLIYLRKQSCNKEISGNMRWMGPAFLKLLGGIVKK